MLKDKELAPGLKRIVLVHRYFDPDMTTYAQMLGHFADHLGREGHDVVVLTGPPNYNGVYDGPRVPRREKRDRYRVVRLRLPGSSGRLAKLIGLALFPVLVGLHIISRRRAYQLISVTTMPPVVMGLAARVARRRGAASVVYHCMDIYPKCSPHTRVGSPVGELGLLVESIPTRWHLPMS